MTTASPTPSTPGTWSGPLRRHAWWIVLLAGTALFLAEERTLVGTQNPNLVPSAILLGASVVPLAFLAFVYGRPCCSSCAATAASPTGC